MGVQMLAMRFPKNTPSSATSSVIVPGNAECRCDEPQAAENGPMRGTFLWHTALSKPP